MAAPATPSHQDWMNPPSDGPSPDDDLAFLNSVMSGQIVHDTSDYGSESKIARAKLRKSISEIINSTLSIEQCFRNVTEGLQAAENVSELFRGDIVLFRNKWEDYHKQYINLLRDFNASAKEARVTSSIFTSDFIVTIQDPETPAKNKKAKVKEYQNKLQTHKKTSSDLSQRFSDLQGNVTAFQIDLQAWIDKTDVSQLKVEIDEITQKIEQAEEAIKELKNKIGMSAASTVGCAGCSAATCVLGFCCPCLWFGTCCTGGLTCVSAFYLGMKLRRRSKHQEIRKAKRTELRGKKEVLDGLTKIKDILGPLENDMTVVSKDLVAFAEAWASIHSALVEIDQRIDIAAEGSTALDGLHPPEEGIAELFKDRIHDVVGLIGVLNDALCQYESAIEKGELFRGIF